MADSRPNTTSRLTALSFASLFLFMSSYGQTANDYSPIHKSSKAITGWATGCTIIRGLVRSDDPLAGYASFGSSGDATGQADNVVVSLGDGGVAVVSFSEPVMNNHGPDFAVFENSFDGKYLELAFVEVSTDSIKWVRFPSVSNLQTLTQTTSFGTSDAGSVHNLAGKHPVLYGTPFFLEDVADSAGIDINNIRFVRIVDVVGSIDTRYCTFDSRSNIINDPWPTPFTSSGFDLDAVAITDISLVGVDNEVDTGILLYPVPATETITLKLPSLTEAQVWLLDVHGNQVAGPFKADETTSIGIGNLVPGIYLTEIRYIGAAALYKRFIKL